MAVRVTPRALVADLRDAALDGQAVVRRLERASETGNLSPAAVLDGVRVLASEFRHWTSLLDRAHDQMRAVDGADTQLRLRLA